MRPSDVVRDSSTRPAALLRMTLLGCEDVTTFLKTHRVSWSQCRIVLLVGLTFQGKVALGYWGLQYAAILWQRQCGCGIIHHTLQTITLLIQEKHGK